MCVFDKYLWASILANILRWASSASSTGHFSILLEHPPRASFLLNCHAGGEQAVGTWLLIVYILLDLWAFKRCWKAPGEQAAAGNSSKQREVSTKRVAHRMPFTAIEAFWSAAAEWRIQSTHSCELRFVPLLQLDRLLKRGFLSEASLAASSASPYHETCNFPLNLFSSLQIAAVSQL